MLTDLTVKMHFSALRRRDCAGAVFLGSAIGQDLAMITPLLEAVKDIGLQRGAFLRVIQICGGMIDAQYAVETDDGVVIEVPGADRVLVHLFKLV